MTPPALTVGRRVRWHLRHPLESARSAVVLLNVRPFSIAFRAIYSLGLRSVVARLSRHDAIHAILGHGSYFQNTSLYGHSDIDLVIIFRRGVRKSEGVHYRVSRTYNAVRRFFPFLGSWDEKEGSLIFLDEVAEGFAPHATFRIRMQRGDFVLLYGEPFPLELGGQPVSVADWLQEIDRLLRWAVVTGEDTARRLLFWQRMFSKLQDVMEGLDVEATLEDAFADPDLSFLGRDPRALFFGSARPEVLFSRFLHLIHLTLEAVEASSEPVRLAYRPFGGHRRFPHPIEIPAFAAGPGVAGAWALPSVPIGLQPRLFYFSVDQPMIVVDLEGDAYVGLRMLLKRLKARGESSDAVIAQAEGFLFLFNREPEFVDVVPLNPLLHANAYAGRAGRLEFCMPTSVYESSKAEANDLFAALRNVYRRHTGRLPKDSYPSIYREDDLDTIRDAFDILRSFATHVHQVSITTSAELVEHLSARHPGSRRFLSALVEYRTFLERGRRGRPPANNLYRCLHRFVASVLDGAEEVEISDYERRIGITVGIITRDRAVDLRNALESLTLQDRVPDEVVIVDNGSTDGTRAVITGFEDRLPLRYVHLSEASIPRARNLVLEHATQEIVSFTDDDCAIPREWLSSVERGFLRADNVGIVGGWVEHWPAERRTMVDTYYEIFHNHKT